MRKLTPRQTRFIDEFIIDLNATQAARRSGYSPRTAASIGQENLRKPEIRATLDQRLAERRKRTQVSQDEVLDELASIAFADPRKLFRADGTIKSPSEMTEDEMAGVASLIIRKDGRGYRLVMHDKTEALEALSRHLGKRNPD